MKRTLIIIGFVFSFLTLSYSQIDKGTLLLGGYSNIIINTDGDFDFGLHPNLGYFFGEHLCLGSSTPIHFYSHESSNGYYLGVSPFLRYYFGENDKTRFFGLAAVNFKVNDSFFIQGTGWVDLGIGYVWFINKSIGLETEFVSNISPDVIATGLYFGLQFYFNN